VKTRIKEALLTECNLHTIVRLPNGVFFGISNVKTNLLFFTKGTPTKEVWYYEHPYPPGQKSYNKSKPIRIEEFEPEKAWWGNEADGFKSRVENEHAWRVSIDQIRAGGFNLDLKNPHSKDDGPGDVDHLLPEYEKLLAQIAETRGQWETARAWLTTWLHLDPDNAGAHQRMGIAMFRLGDADRSLACFREARTLDEKAVHPEIALARLYADAKDEATARRLVESAIAAAPDDPAVHVAAAQWHLGRNDLEAAARAADAALALDPDKLDARIVRGTIARMQRDHAAAATFFEAALAGAPGSFLASNALALALIESDDEAARRRALELAETNAAMHRDGSPHQIGALTTLAWIAYRLGRREDAERILEPISRNNALTADGAFYVATILADRGERDRARAILEEVLATDPLFVTRPDALDLLERLGATAARNVGTPR